MFIKSIDTMMQSRTTCLDWNRLTLPQIMNELCLVTCLGVTHIPICVPFDYPDYLKLWVDGVRLTGKSVWFRMIWNRWTGEYEQPADMTPEEYLAGVDAFIRANPDLFKSGDIFDACPEPENGRYWSTTWGLSWNWEQPNHEPAAIAFNKFTRDMKTTTKKAFREIGVVGVRTDVMSILHFTASRFLEQETVDEYGLITLDSYPEGVQEITPAAAARTRVAEYEELHHLWPDTPILIGEMGYQITMGGVSDETQRAIIAAELDAISALPYIVGLNYWHGSGLVEWNGARLFHGDRNGWVPRPAAQELLRYFQRFH